MEWFFKKRDIRGEFIQESKGDFMAVWRAMKAERLSRPGKDLEVERVKQRIREVAEQRRPRGSVA